MGDVTSDCPCTGYLKVRDKKYFQKTRQHKRSEIFLEQERDPFTDLRRLCVTNLVSFLDTAIVEKMFLPYTPFRKSFPFSHLLFEKSFPFSHLFFDKDFSFYTPFECTLGK